LRRGSCSSDTPRGMLSFWVLMEVLPLTERRIAAYRDIVLSRYPSACEHRFALFLEGANADMIVPTADRRL
jgi:hypothetical protein